MSIIKIKDKSFKSFIPEAVILEKVKAVADRLNKDFAGKNPLFLAVLNGSFIYAADLMRMLTIPCEISFVKLASYQGTTSTGKVIEVIGINESLKGRTIVIVEDIVDTGLTMKRMICEGSDIEFSCLVNGALLNFMEESDIYSLFGNLLDNAIEEARHFDSEHRVISLSVAQEQQFVLIHEENFIQAVPQMVDGLPQTTKADKENHGFGVRSMRLIAEKYNGHFMIHVDKSLFRLDIMLPIPPAEG